LVLGFALALLTRGSSVASELILTVPDALHGFRDLAGLERFEGRADLGPMTIAYALYVDPRYPALYRLTHYRVTVVTRTADGREETQADEILLWNDRPGAREPLHCYTLQRAVSSVAHWDRVASGTNAYQDALKTSIFIYGDHARRTRRALQ
jgi:hypothetical protein